MNNLTTKSNLAEALGQINSKLDRLLDNVDDLKLGQAKLKIQVENIKSTFKELKNERKTLTTDVSSFKEAKLLIIPAVVRNY